MTSRASQPEAWFDKADHDLLAVDQLTAAPTVLWDIVAYHAQQGAEKYLKAETRAGVAIARRIRTAVRQRIRQARPADKRFP